MKKAILTLFAAVALSFSASAQIDFGVEGGAAANWIPKTTKGLGATVLPKIGFYAGAFGIFEFSETMVGQVEVMYAMKGYAEKTALNSKYSIALSYIEVPVMVGWKMADDMFTIKVGPEFDFCIGGSIHDGPYTYKETDHKPFQLLVAVQTTYMFNENFGVDVKFDAGVTRTFNDYTLSGELIHDKGRNASIRVGLRYCFN